MYIKRIVYNSVKGLEAYDICPILSLPQILQFSHIYKVYTNTQIKSLYIDNKSNHLYIYTIQQNVHFKSTCTMHTLISNSAFIKKNKERNMDRLCSVDGSNFQTCRLKHTHTHTHRFMYLFSS